MKTLYEIKAKRRALEIDEDAEKTVDYVTDFVYDTVQADVKIYGVPLEKVYSFRAHNEGPKDFMPCVIAKLVKLGFDAYSTDKYLIIRF